MLLGEGVANAWMKFQKLLQLFAENYISMTLTRKVYEPWIRSPTSSESETWIIDEGRS